MLGRAKALIVEMLTPVSLSFHQLKKGLQVIFRGSDVRCRDAALRVHPFHGVTDPSLQKELAAWIDREWIRRLQSGRPELFLQIRGGHNQ